VRKTLIKYWGYSTFRPMQEEIIQSVLDGKDALALLPTGGGKSICFQVPALMMEGVCLVVTPLIALMKDQIENLKQKGIKAYSIHSGMHINEVDLAYNSCAYGNSKFLYVSPERLESPAFIENIQKIKVNLLVVDEAHCVSQWGYDFRPPYLRIAEIKNYLPKVPTLALTATATPEVVGDIQDKLGFKQKNILQVSFNRKNLTYSVVHEEDKLKRLLKIYPKIKGSGIIYVRNRRKTKEVSDFLVQNQINADFYHAGLDMKLRSEKQTKWKRSKNQVMVATNAFGMGIDKPDVRFVVHLDLPDNLESYFQEAGRAGRDENDAYSIILYENADIINLKKNFTLAFPKIDIIKDVYQALGNYFQLAVGSGKNAAFDFDIIDFCRKFNFQPIIAFNSLKFLEKESYVSLSESFNNQARIRFVVNRENLYKFQVENSYYDHFIKLLLRSYSGLFQDFTKISETELANRLSVDVPTVVKYLKRLEQYEILNYIPQKSKPQLIFLSERSDAKQILISDENYRNIKKAATQRLNMVLAYIETNNKCRSQQLISYFGEMDSERCGNCDVCLKRNKVNISATEFDRILTQLKPLLLTKPHYMQELIDQSEEYDEDDVIAVIRWLQGNGNIEVNEKNQLSWRKQLGLNF
jgi:ATP-dependent DNA helicase RecQ